MLYQEMCFACDVCPPNKDGELRVCHYVRVWVNGGTGLIMHEVICEVCGHAEEYPLSSLQVIADFEEQSSQGEFLAEHQDAIM